MSGNESFFFCKTRSSDSTHAKFDFNDPEQCSICPGFNPFKEEPIEGEELANDDEPDGDNSDEEKDETTTATTGTTTTDPNATTTPTTPTDPNATTATTTPEVVEKK